MLHLLAVAGGLLERLDDERGRGGHHGHLRLTVLHGELHGDAKAVPVLLGLLGDVFADLLGGQTERTDLRRERRGSADLATGGAEEHLDDGGGIELRRHPVRRGRSEVTEGSVPVVDRRVARRARGGADAGARESGNEAAFTMARGKCSQPSGPANQRPTKHASRASRGSGVKDHPSRVFRKTRTCLIGSVRVRVEKGEGADHASVLAK